MATAPTSMRKKHCTAEVFGNIQVAYQNHVVSRHLDVQCLPAAILCAVSTQKLSTCIVQLRGAMIFVASRITFVLPPRCLPSNPCNTCWTRTGRWIDAGTVDLVLPSGSSAGQAARPPF